MMGGGAMHRRPSYIPRMPLWLGIATFVLGAFTWRYARRLAPVLPLWVPRLGLAITALGIGTLAIGQSGVGWKLVSSVFSAAAIIFMIGVLRDILRR
jgi:hypothetical protein